MMKPARKRRLMLIGFIILGMSSATTLVFAALGNNMNHYYELKTIQLGEAPIGKTIRIGGMVKKQSIKRTDGSLKMTFTVTDFTRNVSVQYDGVLPDLFR
ncbi:MAG: cytochrome c maturation protein CcmE, partial [Ostreibacterium sp.]